MAVRWLDVNSAAEELGISTDAVRKRIARGSLESQRQNRSVLVWLDDSGPKAGREAQVEGGALPEAKDEMIHLLDEQLGLRAEEIQRRDAIITRLTRATSNLTDRLRELEVIALVVLFRSYRKGGRWAWWSLWSLPLLWLSHFLFNSTTVHNLVIAIITAVGLILSYHVFFGASGEQTSRVS